MRFKGHRPFEYMTKSFKDAVYSTLERYWSSAYGKTWKKKYDTIIPAMTAEIRAKREEEIARQRREALERSRRLLARIAGSQPTEERSILSGSTNG